MNEEILKVFQALSKQKDRQAIDSVWVATTISLSRNLSSFLFPHLLGKDDLLNILSVVIESLKNVDKFSSYPTMAIKDLSSKHKEFLQEYYLLESEGAVNSEGQAFICNPESNLLLKVNGDNHLLLHGITLEKNPEKLLQKLVNIDEAMQKRLSFAFSKEFGFLTTKPIDCGTGLKIRVFLHLPGAIYLKKLEDYIFENQNLVFEHVLPQGYSYPGNIIVITNKASLGETEEEILLALKEEVQKLAQIEEEAKKTLQEDPCEKFKNFLSRSIGLLQHSFLLELEETLNALSWIFLGLATQKVRSAENLFQEPLFWNIRRAHLALKKELENSSQNINYEDIPRERASYLQQKVKGLMIN